jgi:hypothetical protein
VDRVNHRSLEAKIRSILPYADRSLIEAYSKHEPRLKLIDCKLPEGIILVDTGDAECKYLVADRVFKKGELVYTNEFQNETDFSTVFVMDIKDQLMLINHANHFIYRDGYMEAIGFDIFLDHSCEPSVRQQYESANKYHVYALHDIHKGEKITCDFLAAAGIRPTQRYECMCGSERCRGDLYR